MLNKRTVALVAVLLALTPSVSANTSAQQNPQLRGTWNLNRTASDDVGMINNAAGRQVAGSGSRLAMVSKMSIFNVASPQVVISFDARNVRIEEQGRPSATIPANGSPVLWYAQPCRECSCELREDGQCVELSAAFRHQQLELTLEGWGTTQVRRFSANGDTLTMEVMVTDARLPQSLNYKLVYDRQK